MHIERRYGEGDRSRRFAERRDHRWNHSLRSRRKLGLRKRNAQHFAEISVQGPDLKQYVGVVKMDEAPAYAEASNHLVCA